MKIPSIGRLFYNNKFLALFSVAVSFLVWFLVVSNIATSYTKSIASVKVTLENGGVEGSELGVNNLHLIELANQTVTVEVSGPRYLVGRLKSGDFTARLRTGSVQSSGTYPVQVDASFNSPDPQLSIQRVTPSTINIYVDTVGSRSIPVTIDTGGAKAASGYMIQKPVATPASVSVTGPIGEIDKIVKAIATVDVPSAATASVTANSKVVLFNEKKEANMKHLKMDVSEVSVAVSVLKVRQLTPKIEVTGIPSFFSADNISIAYDPAKLRAAGKGDVIDALDGSLSLGSVNFYQLGVQNTFSYDIAMPENTIEADGVSKVGVTGSLKDTAQKTVTLKPLNPVNLASGFGVTVNTKQFDNVTLFGPAATIDALPAEVAVNLDLTGVTKLGRNEVPVVLTQNGCWTQTPYKAVVYIWKR